MPPKARQRLIALALHEDSGFVRSVTRGIGEFFVTARPWHLVRVPPERLGRGVAIPRGCDGVITHVHHRRLLGPLRRAGCPVVCVSKLMEDDPFPLVGVDDRAVGEMGAAHLLDRGLTSFAYLGLYGLIFSHQREAGFAEALDRAGHPTMRRRLTASWLVQTPPDTQPRLRALDDWLRNLRRPTGLFAANDAVAWFVMERCRNLGLRVPLDLAVLGVDDDDVLCRLTHPPLSSIQLPGQRIGHLAAERLEAAIQSGGPADPMQLPPLRVEARQSTHVLAVDDPAIADALVFIRDHATQGIGVEDVLQAVPLGRRSMERRFRATTQRSVLDEIHRVRVEAAKTLLTTTNLPIDQVGERVGFSQANYFAKIFKRHAGRTPRVHRRLGG